MGYQQDIYSTKPLGGGPISRRYTLGSGKSIATFCPADGSVVPVSAGDQLYMEDSKEWLTAYETTSGSVMEWCGSPEFLNPRYVYVTGVSIPNNYSYVQATLNAKASVMWVRNQRLTLRTSAGGTVHDASNYMNITYTFFHTETTSVVWDTSGGLTTDEVYKNINADEIITIPALDSDSGWVWVQCQMDLTVGAGAPPDIRLFAGNLIVYPVYR